MIVHYMRVLGKDCAVVAAAHTTYLGVPLSDIGQIVRDLMLAGF